MCFYFSTTDGGQRGTNEGLDGLGPDPHPLVLATVRRAAEAVFARHISRIKAPDGARGGLRTEIEAGRADAEDRVALQVLIRC